MAFAVSTVISGLGLAVAAGGLALNISGQQKAADAQAAAARSQAQIAGLQASNVDVQQQQLDLTSSQQHLQNETQRSVIAQQSQADALRLQASELDATRRRRDAIRQGVVAGATSLARATNQGASSPGSTVIAQSQADIAGQASTNIQGINQNIDVGRKLYAINKSITDTYLNASYQNDSYVDKSKGLQQQVLGTQKQIYALGGSASESYAQAASAQGNAALGQGLFSLGTGVANAYPTINRLTNYFSNTGTGNASDGVGGFGPTAPA